LYHHISELGLAKESILEIDEQQFQDGIQSETRRHFAYTLEVIQPLSKTMTYLKF
jgi:hypothetical protein